MTAQWRYFVLMLAAACPTAAPQAGGNRGPAYLKQMRAMLNTSLAWDKQWNAPVGSVCQLLELRLVARLCAEVGNSRLGLISEERCTVSFFEKNGQLFSWLVAPQNRWSVREYADRFLDSTEISSHIPCRLFPIGPCWRRAGKIPSVCARR